MTVGIRVVVNGRPRQLPAGTTVAAVVSGLTGARAGTGTGTGVAVGVAVAVNDAVVPRGAWESVLLHDADRVEVLTAVQGG